MQIQNVLSGYTDPPVKYTDPPVKRQAEFLDAAGRIVIDQGTVEAGPGGSAAEAARHVLGAYDVTRITPKQFTEMIQRLFDAAVITQQEYEQLAAIRLDLDVGGIDADAPVDLLEFYRDQIEQVHRRNERGASVPDALRTRFDWVEKFAMLQAAPGTFGLDTVA